MSKCVVFKTTLSSFALGAFLASGFVAVFVALLCLGSFAPIVTILALAMMVAAWFALVIAWSGKLVVGTDGVLILRKLGRSELITYSELLDVDRYSESNRQRNGRLQYAGITLHLKTKRFVNVPLNLNLNVEQPDRVSRPYELIRQRLTEWRALPPTQDAAPLARDGRPMRAWTEALRELGGPTGATYRVATIDDETLVAITEDPTKQASLRAAAAFALRAKLDEGARKRLRVSANTTADPTLRAVIEHVVEEKSEAAIEALLEKTDPVQQV